MSGEFNNCLEHGHVHPCWPGEGAAYSQVQADVQSIVRSYVPLTKFYGVSGEDVAGIGNTDAASGITPCMLADDIQAYYEQFSLTTCALGGEVRNGWICSSDCLSCAPPADWEPPPTPNYCQQL
jgi:hypothetical protein